MRTAERRSRRGGRLTSDTAEDGPRVVHTFVGHFAPRCTVCGRTLMQITQHPEWLCRRATLPFEEQAIVKADLKPKNAALVKKGTV